MIKSNRKSSSPGKQHEHGCYCKGSGFGHTACITEQAKEGVAKTGQKGVDKITPLGGLCTSLHAYDGDRDGGRQGMTLGVQKSSPLGGS